MYKHSLAITVSQGQNGLCTICHHILKKKPFQANQLQAKVPPGHYFSFFHQRNGSLQTRKNDTCFLVQVRLVIGLQRTR